MAVLAGHIGMPIAELLEARGLIGHGARRIEITMQHNGAYGLHVEYYLTDEMLKAIRDGADQILNAKKGE